MNPTCARVESLAGAIALGEASDAERDEYRRHIAACAPCLRALGGEREIERVMSAVADARDAETWEPIVPSARDRRTRLARSAWRVGLSGVALAIVASLGLHVLLAAAVPTVRIADASVVPVLPVSGMHVTLDERTPAPKSVAAAPPVRAVSESLVVVHNVIALKASTPANVKAARGPASATETRISTRSVVAMATSAPSNVPIWRRDAAMPVANATHAPLFAGRAESIAVAPVYVVHDVTPLGGDGAISPRPPLIAYAEGAEGTTAFEVTVDEHGAPQHCTITKSSGYFSLDGAVCAAAMHARYVPRTVNGRATPGVYRDAFTFRSQSQDDGPAIPQR